MVTTATQYTQAQIYAGNFASVVAGTFHKHYTAVVEAYLESLGMTYENARKFHIAYRSFSLQEIYYDGRIVGYIETRIDNGDCTVRAMTPIEYAEAQICLEP